MIQPLRTRWLLLGTLLACTAASAQSMYKWTDENGRVTYSDQPPVGKVKSREVINIPGAANPGAARQMIDQDTQFKKRQDDALKKQTEAAKKEEIDKQRTDNCARARAELRAMRDNAPLMKLNENGERVMLDSGGREGESRRLETYLEENCQQSG